MTEEKQTNPESKFWKVAKYLLGFNLFYVTNKERWAKLSLWKSATSPFYNGGAIILLATSIFGISLNYSETGEIEPNPYTAFKNVMARADKKWEGVAKERELVEKVLREADINHDGKLSLDEFVGLSRKAGLDTSSVSVDLYVPSGGSRPHFLMQKYGCEITPEQLEKAVESYK